ncbi:MAG: hypothetical protein M1834_005869 [Cirrosporium novae-zelandiae]|nr:MAG: hypothetical protein M1834_005869 [Cirrosporium novae-zelandiae]
MSPRKSSYHTLWRQYHGIRPIINTCQESGSQKHELETRRTVLFYYVMEPCFDFSARKSKRSSARGYNHGPSTSSGDWKSRRPCRFFFTPQGCLKGDNCHFSHSGENNGTPFEQYGGTQLSEPRHEPQIHGSNRTLSIPTLESDFQAWRFLVPKNPRYGRSLVGEELRHFAQGGLKLVNSDIGFMQEVITLMASEGGLSRVKELIERNFEAMADKAKIVVVMTEIIPFFQTLSHPDVVLSALLENPVSTIYTYIYGPGGRRTVKLFTLVVDVLSFQGYSSLTIEDHDISSLVETTLAVLAKVIDLNGAALLNEALYPIVEALDDLLDELNLGNGPLSECQARKYLGKIHRRLGLGRDMPLNELKNKHQVPITNVSFVLHQDLPGNLSVEGPRHDNDHADIREIQIMPTYEEIESVRREYLPINDPSESYLPGVEGLFDRQFRLLREDTVGQLRDAIRAELEQRHNVQEGVVTRPHYQQGTRIYTYLNVAVLDISFGKWRGFEFSVSFNQLPHLRNMTLQSRQEWWKGTRRLQPFALICLLGSHGSAIFCSVSDPSKTEEPQSDASSATIFNLSEDPDKAFLTLRLVKNDESSIKQILDRYKMSKNIQQDSLIEFPGVLLPSFQPTLLALQRLAITAELPFAQILAPTDTKITGLVNIEPPPYTIRQNFRFNLGCILKHETDLSFSPGEPFDLKAFQEMSVLDDAQASALIDSLSRSLALIQGPPGTGKSFTGVAIIKVLLSNKKHAKLGPIVCVTYTNHALDQLLEELIHSGISQVIRIGGRSKSELLQPLNLRLVAKKVEQTKVEKRRKWELAQALEKDEDALSDFFSTLNKLDSWTSIKNYLEVHHSEHHNELFGQPEEGWEVVHHHPENIIDNWLYENNPLFSKRFSRVRPISRLLQESLYAMSSIERATIHAHWLSSIKNDIYNNIMTALMSYLGVKADHDQIRNELDLRCLQQANVIGVTTSGLAKNIDLLQRLQSKVMLCEEAGEVLEAHLLTAFLPSIEHAILIGDHLQLRPRIQNYELQRENARGAQYSLDVSLFERLVQPPVSSGLRVPFSTLETQRRMDPSIAQLIRATLYPALKDSPAVEGYPKVAGMKKRLFWFDHIKPEADADTQDAMPTSHWNDFELDMVASLVSHLVRQGVYETEDIAVLTPYLGQLLKIRRRLRDSFEVVVNDRDLRDLERNGIESYEDAISSPVSKIKLLQALKVATIDNFQGEEAKIVIISLVRSNERNRCGFLRTSNRINVLLSRAKHGMYIIGNSRTSSHVAMWADVLAILKQSGNIGGSFELQCPRHLDKLIEVSTPDDFQRLSPEGGCDERCTKRLKCGHACVNKCHSEVLHSAVKCLEPCPRPRIGCEHPCNRVCGDICDPKCPIEVYRTDLILPCGHKKDHLPCWNAQHLISVRCTEKVQSIVPGNPVRTAELDITKGLYKKTMELVRNPVAVITQPATTDVSPHAMELAHVHPVMHPAPFVVVIRDVIKNAMSLARPAPKKTVHRRVLTAVVLCLVQLHAIGFLARSVARRYCQKCATEDIKDITVDFILMQPYRDIDLDESPCIVPQCGHILTVDSMDGQMDMAKHYTFSEQGIITEIKKTYDLFSMEAMKVCATCRGSLRDLSRYGRIVRGAFLDEATKKFIVWANKEYIPLAKQLQVDHELLVGSVDTTAYDFQGFAKPEELRIEGNHNEQIKTIYDWAGPKRYESILRLWGKIKAHMGRMRKEEQPFKRVWDMVINAKRRHKTLIDFTYDSNVIQMRGYLLASALLIRCDLAMLSDVKTLIQNAPKDLVQFSIELSYNRKDCLKLIKLAKSSNHLFQEVEGHIFFAHYSALESSTAAEEVARGLREDALTHVDYAKALCEDHPAQTRGMMEDVDAVRKMLRGETFYGVVSNDEKRSILAAMATELRGTGHWYNCENGHAFTVGECGMPMETSRCPECGAGVGGQHHEAMVGVTHAAELEREFSTLNIGY